MNKLKPCVKLPKNHIVIDFDLKDKEGIHLHYIYDGDGISPNKEDCQTKSCYLCKAECLLAEVPKKTVKRYETYNGDFCKAKSDFNHICDEQMIEYAGCRGCKLDFDSDCYLMWLMEEIEVPEANGVAIEALEKSEKYAWHDLRKDPMDLPSRKGWVECWLYVKDVISYSMDLYFYPDKNMFMDNRRKNVFEMYEVMVFDPTGVNMRKHIYTDDLCNRTSEVIAWRYKEPFLDLI